MQLFPRSRKKKLLIFGRLATQTWLHMGKGHAEVSQTWVQGPPQKKASDAGRWAFIHVNLGTKTHVLHSGASLFPDSPFCSSHLLWSKAFPAHLLSPVRWLSNNSCYLVNRWESELNLFSESLGFGLSRVNSASRTPSWKACVSRDEASERGSSSTWFNMKEKKSTFISDSQANLWSEADLKWKSACSSLSLRTVIQAITSMSSCLTPWTFLLCS